MTDKSSRQGPSAASDEGATQAPDAPSAPGDHERAPVPARGAAPVSRRQQGVAGEHHAEDEAPGRARLLDDLTGGRHAIAYIRHLARGNQLPKTELMKRLDPEHPPVVMIHGFLGTRGSMYILERRLTDDGICVFSYNLGILNTHDIRESAQLVNRKIDSILAQTRLPRVDIVGHSMGGLIGLHIVKKLGGDDKVRKLVMLGTPVLGTWSSLIGMGTVGLVSRSTWQIHPWSPYLDELRSGALPRGVEYYTISAERDWVCPPAATVLEGAKRITVPLGHSSLVISAEVYRHVRAALRS